MKGAILEIRAFVQSVVVWCNGLYRRGNMAGRLQDKVTVVTGAGNGIGRATALRFAEEGSSVIVADIQIEKADETKGRDTRFGGIKQECGIHTNN